MVDYFKDNDNQFFKSLLDLTMVSFPSVDFLCFYFIFWVDFFKQNYYNFYLQFANKNILALIKI